MANNKFIERLKGQPTAGSLVEIKNTSAKTSFANMPVGSSNAVDVFSDHRNNATIVANGTLLWKIDGETLESVESVFGDGKDFSSVQSVAGSGLWLNASYTFPSTGDPNHPIAMVFNPNTKWVLKLCGDNLIVDGGNVVDFTLIVKIGSAHIFSKNFKVAENAGQFSTEFILDFEETNTGIVKAGGLAKLTLQLLCGTENASARIYNGMTVLTCLQRKVDASAVSSTNANVQDVLDGNIIPDDYFSNPEFIDQIEDGKDAYAVFNRDGDSVILSGWTPKEDIATAAQLNTEIQNRISADNALGLRIDNETTARENADTALQGQITSNKNAIDAHVADTANPHNVTKAQVGLGNVDNTSDLDKPISTATQTALDGKMSASVKYGAALSLTINSTNYVVTAQLKDQDGNNLGTAQTIDLPLESVVVSGAYDSATKEVVLTLQDGSTIRFSVADLVSGLQTEITALNMLSADLVDDTNTTHKFVTTTEKTTWNGKQDAISDLATIRSNAQAGKAASDTIATYGNIVTHNVSEFATATQGAKADTAVQPSDVGNGTITIKQGGETKGTFATNQGNDTTIELDAGGGSSSGYHPDLFDHKWADHLLNDVSWLRADTFSWQSGDVYVAAYNHLAGDIGGKTLQSETIDGTTIQFYLADDGHKICPASEESNVSAIYNSTDVAWYYILDTTNRQFKLPRTKWNFTGIRDGVGNYVPAGLPNITGDIIPTSAYSGVVATDAFYGTERSASTITNGGSGSNAGNRPIIGMSASRSSSIYGNSTTVQPKATEMYLYFYVGNFTQTAIEQTAGLNAEMFNDLNAHKVIEFQTPTASNGYTWYRKYADGWVEQGGTITTNETSNLEKAITLPIEMSDNHYMIHKTYSKGANVIGGNNWSWMADSLSTNHNTTTTIYLSVPSNSYVLRVLWQVSGMAK